MVFTVSSPLYRILQVAVEAVCMRHSSYWSMALMPAERRRPLVRSSPVMDRLVVRYELQPQASLCTSLPHEETHPCRADRIYHPINRLAPHLGP
jgi:hypothetical protein